MFYGLLKLASLSGIGVAVGGIAIGSYIFSSPNEKSTTRKISPYESTKENLLEQRNETPAVTRKCVIFETDEAVVVEKQMKITKILKRYDDLNKFLEGITDGGNDKFKQDVNNACKGKNAINHPVDKNIAIYVYKKKKDGLWNYTKLLQNKDWSKDSNIKSNSSEVNLDWE